MHPPPPAQAQAHAQETQAQAHAQDEWGLLVEPRAPVEAAACGLAKASVKVWAKPCTLETMVFAVVLTPWHTDWAKPWMLPRGPPPAPVGVPVPALALPPCMGGLGPLAAGTPECAGPDWSPPMTTQGVRPYHDG